jgi:hypothetical protein
VKEELPARHDRNKVLIPPEDMNLVSRPKYSSKELKKIYNIISFCVSLYIAMHESDTEVMNISNTII